MTRWERVRSAFKGEEVDRPPISMWRHFYEKETSAEGLAEAMLGFQREFDWDFVKVNPRACYHVENWGARFEFSGNPHIRPRRVDYPVKSADDWQRIGVLSPHRGVLGEMLSALRLIRDDLKGDAPFIMTVFTPLSIASRLVESDEATVQYMRETPKAVHQALSIIAETFSGFVHECLNAGANGIFFATTSWATHNMLSESQYKEFGRPYDLSVLKAAQSAELNILHVCRGNNMLGLLADYPVHAFNWDARDPTNLPLAEGQRLTGKAVVGGISHKTTLRRGSPGDVTAEIRKAREETAGRRWIAGPGCTIPTDTPKENLKALKETQSLLGA